MIFRAATPYSGLTASDLPSTSDMRSEPTRKIAVPVQPPDMGKGEVRDQVTLSGEGVRLSRRQSQTEETGSRQQTADPGKSPEGKSDSEPNRLSPEEQQVVQQLKNRDREVKAHEQAHLANAGQYATGGPSYTYQTGPDGRRYAVGGEVPIDVGREKTPEQTIQKMRTVRRAALAPANPSSADRSIAAAASMLEAQAMREMNMEEQSPAEDTDPATAEQTQGDLGAYEQQDSAPASPVRRQNFQAIYA